MERLGHPLKPRPATARRAEDAAAGSAATAARAGVPSPNCDARPAGAQVTLLVLHTISLPPGRRSAGDAIERLFTNRLDPRAHPSFAELARRCGSRRISSSGATASSSSSCRCGRRAWHAGVSRWRGRARCNDFSVGIELEGTDDGAFAAAQYRRLAGLIRRCRTRCPIARIAAHSDVAPGRKTDPGPRASTGRACSRASPAPSRYTCVALRGAHVSPI